ncbi:MAG: SusD/RagB family nutrient-binding outer membrane lipoprotein, partial [Bacteroidota bacterium]
SGSNANQIAVARILKAYFFHHLTDRWGALPYSQALLGRENFKPSYDSQEAIYDAIFSELTAAVAQIDGGDGVDGDFIFGGDMDKWARFANTVRMIAALRLTKVNPSKAQSEFNAAVAGGLIEEDAMYPYLSETNNQNPWFGRFITRTDYAISNVLADRMTVLNDPRLAAYADPAPATGTIVGMPYGIEDAGSVPNSDVSFPHVDNVRGQAAPIGIITMAQVYFSLAEAAVSGWTSDDAEEMYNLGIKASMEQWGVFEETAYNDYIANDAPYDAANPLPGIGEQKWIALYLQGYEAWKEWRRTGYPDLQPAPDPLNASGEIPRRQAYPVTERDLNEENYNAAVSAQGADELSTRTWWDVQ